MALSRPPIAALAVSLVLCTQAWPQLQHRVDPQHLYYRAYCVVPFIGSGTPEDPRRPKHAPAPSQLNSSAGPLSGIGSASRTGILGWTMVESDDGKSALVEFVAADRASLQEILEDTGIQAFEKTRSNADEVEKVLKRYRKDFNMRYFGVRVK